MILFFLAFIFNYNFPKFFDQYNTIIYHSVGRITYSIIYSLTGYFLGSIDILKRFKRIVNFKILFTYPFVFYIIKEYKIFYKYSPKLWFIVIDISIIILFLAFGLLPFDYIKSKKIIFLIKNITSFTGGIYYLHCFVYNLFSDFMPIIKFRGILTCFIIYILCYIICCFFSNIFKKSKLKYLFI